jgi:hypothetical protein
VRSNRRFLSETAEMRQVAAAPLRTLVPGGVTGVRRLEPLA